MLGGAISRVNLRLGTGEEAIVRVPLAAASVGFEKTFHAV
jgi:hypothetical protein